MEGEGYKSRERELWRDYLFLTREMGRALHREDFDLFTELLRQRERLQEMIEAVPASAWPEKGELLKEIHRENQQVQAKLGLYKSRWETRRDGAMAYEGPPRGGLGRLMDQQI